MRHPAMALRRLRRSPMRSGRSSPCIFHEGAGANPDELLRHLHETGLSRYDMPEYFIAMSAYPLTASGKILKRELVEWAKSGQIRPEPVRWTNLAREQER